MLPPSRLAFDGSLLAPLSLLPVSALDKDPQLLSKMLLLWRSCGV